MPWSDIALGARRGTPSCAPRRPMRWPARPGHVAPPRSGCPVRRRDGSGGSGRVWAAEARWEAGRGPRAPRWAAAQASGRLGPRCTHRTPPSSAVAATNSRDAGTNVTATTSSFHVRWREAAPTWPERSARRRRGRQGRKHRRPPRSEGLCGGLAEWFGSRLAHHVTGSSRRASGTILQIGSADSAHSCRSRHICP